MASRRGRVVLDALLLALVLLAACDGGAGAPPDARPTSTSRSTTAAAEPEIRAAFSAYAQALADREGEAAARLLSATSLDYYQEMGRLALHASAQEVRHRPIGDRLTILMFRHLLSADGLENMSGSDLVAFAVQEGLFGETGSVGQELGDITVDGDSAEAAADVNGQPGGLTLDFRREGGEWKLDLIALIEALHPALENAASQAGLTEDKFLIQIIDDLGNKPVPDSIWEPLRG